MTFDVQTVIGRLRGLASDTHDIEAKSAAGGLPEGLATTLSAFSNSPGGGTIILGVDERSGFRPVPIDVATVLRGVADIARSAIEPPASLEFFEAELDGQPIVACRVHELDASSKPCRVRRSRKAYLRSWDGDFELSDLELQGLLTNRTQPRFDIEPVPGTSRDDLDPGLVESYIATARASDRGLARLVSDGDLLVRTGVLTADGIPTVAGLLSLGSYPQQWFPNFVIQAAATSAADDSADVRFSDVVRFSGPIPQMIDDVIVWVAQHSRHRIVDGPDGRVRDQFDFPSVAIRELVANALVHRDLAEWAWSRAVELRIDDAELRLVNPGGLYGLSVSRLFENQLTSARNLALTRICQFVTLRDGRAVEALASGMPKILQATVGTGLPTPRFFDQAIAFTAILTRPSAAPTQTPNVSIRRRQPGERPELSPAERRVFDALGRGRASVDEVADRLQISPAGVRRHIRRLLDLGVITRHGGAGHKDTTYSPYTLTNEAGHLRVRFFTAGGVLAADRAYQTEEDARASIAAFLSVGEPLPSTAD